MPTGLFIVNSTGHNRPSHLQSTFEVPSFISSRCQIMLGGERSPYPTHAHNFFPIPTPSPQLQSPSPPRPRRHCPCPRPVPAKVHNYSTKSILSVLHICDTCDRCWHKRHSSKYILLTKNFTDYFVNLMSVKQQMQLSSTYNLSELLLRL